MLVIWNAGNNQKEAETSSDWPFMEQSEKVLSNLPETWRTYPETEEGMTGIIMMEYNELMKKDTRQDRMHELVHLASACLHYWRYLNNADDK